MKKKTKSIELPKPVVDFDKLEKGQKILCQYFNSKDGTWSQEAHEAVIILKTFEHAFTSTLIGRGVYVRKSTGSTWFHDYEIKGFIGKMEE